MICKITLSNGNYKNSVSLDLDDLSGRFLFSYLYIFSNKIDWKFPLSNDLLVEGEILHDLEVLLLSATRSFSDSYIDMSKEKSRRLDSIYFEHKKYIIDYYTEFGRAFLKINNIYNLICGINKTQGQMTIFCYEEIRPIGKQILRMIEVKTVDDEEPYTLGELMTHLNVNKKEFSKEIRFLQNQFLLKIDSDGADFFDKKVSLSKKGIFM